MNSIACPIFSDYAEQDPGKEHILAIIDLAVTAQIPSGQLKPELITLAQYSHQDTAL